MKKFKIKIIMVILITLTVTLCTNSFLYAAPLEDLEDELGQGLQKISLKADKTELTKTINMQYVDNTRAVMLLSKVGYTTQSWDKYYDALEYAKDIEGKDHAPQKKVNDAKTDLEAKRLALKADLTAYNAALAHVSQGDYTIVSWNAYQLVVTANVVTAESTPAQVATATKNITDAQASLVLKANLDAYNAALAHVNSGDYTTRSWNAYQAVVAANPASVEDSQAAVDAATKNITDAQANLVLKANLTAYNAAIAAVPQGDRYKYTKKIWDAYQAVVAANLVTTENTQEEVDTATANIIAAQKNLIADLTDYNKVLAQVDQENCTAESWRSYQLVVRANIMTINNTQPQVIAATVRIMIAQWFLQVDPAAYNALITAFTADGYTKASWDAYQLVLSNNKLEGSDKVEDVTRKTRNIKEAQGKLEADLTEYNLVINSVAQEDYTLASWNVYQVVVSANLVTVANTPAQVTIAVNAIRAAQSSLVFAGRADLDLAIANANKKLQADYTAESWQVLVNALALPETTNAEVVAKTEAINDAVDALVFLGRADLDLAIANANKKLQADYTPDSFITLTNALALPETTNAEVLIKTIRINNAISALVFSGRANLDIAIANANLKLQADYTVESFIALLKAKALPETTNTEISAKTIAINNAISALVFAGQANLDAAISAARLKSQADYTPESWQVLVNASRLSNKTNAEVVAKTEAINNAISALVFAGKANLDAAKINANTKRSIDYTSASWNAIVSAVALPETTNAEVVVKTEAINNAVKGLVFIGKANLDIAKANAATKLQSLYTVASYAALTSALVLPETTNAEVVVKTVAINNAISGLTLISVKYKVTAYLGLNCRVEPNIYSNRVRAFLYGTILEITEIKNGWGKTQYGWVCMTYVIKVDIAVPTLKRYEVTPFIGVNCRVAPTIYSNKVTAYAYRTVLEITEILSGWGRTQRGWVCMQFLRNL